jgi:hypothetical protein
MDCNFHAVGIYAGDNRKTFITQKISDFVAAHNGIVLHCVGTLLKKFEYSSNGEIFRAVKACAVQHLIFCVANVQNINASSAYAFACKRVVHKAVFFADAVNNLFSCLVVGHYIVVCHKIFLSVFFLKLIQMRYKYETF